MLAWSFDRLMPRQLGQVDKRFHAPLIATAICGVVSLVSLWVYVYTPYLGFFSQLFAVAFSFLVTSIAAIVFPFRKKEMFESSPANIKIAGVPLMALIGVANTIFMLVFIYQNWTDAALGSNSPQSVALILGILVISFVLYWVIRAFRKRQGIDIDALYREIPPE
jgi:amino acid transporter